jgi:hypothetical protein
MKFDELYAFIIATEALADVNYVPSSAGGGGYGLNRTGKDWLRRKNAEEVKKKESRDFSKQYDKQRTEFKKAYGREPSRDPNPGITQALQDRQNAQFRRGKVEADDGSMVDLKDISDDHYAQYVAGNRKYHDTYIPPTADWQGLTPSDRRDIANRQRGELTVKGLDSTLTGLGLLSPAEHARRLKLGKGAIKVADAAEWVGGPALWAKKAGHKALRKIAGKVSDGVATRINPSRLKSLIPRTKGDFAAVGSATGAYTAGDFGQDQGRKNPDPIEFAMKQGPKLSAAVKPFSQWVGDKGEQFSDWTSKRNSANALKKSQANAKLLNK